MRYAEIIWDHDEAEHQVFIEQLAPIVLFTYNRLEHTRQTVETLQKNLYARNSLLYVFSDGTKIGESVDKVVAVRKYLYTITGFKEVKIIEREDNWGLAKNIIDGVTGIVNTYGKVIVLEDDIHTSPYFLKYMNDALKIYEHQADVMMVNGYIYPINTDDLPESFFIKIGGCWGWATWKSRWKYFLREPEQIRKEFSDEERFSFNFDGCAPSRFAQIEKNCSGVLYTWAIFWDVAVFRHGFSLNPKMALSNNCGMDGTGEHCSAETTFDASLARLPVSRFPLLIKENDMARNRIAAFYRKVDFLPWWRRLLHWGKVKCFGDVPVKDLLQRGRGWWSHARCPHKRK